MYAKYTNGYMDPMYGKPSILSLIFFTPLNPLDLPKGSPETPNKGHRNLLGSLSSRFASVSGCGLWRLWEGLFAPPKFNSKNN